MLTEQSEVLQAEEIERRGTQKAAASLVLGRERMGDRQWAVATVKSP
jgi:hypothetical protein